MFKHDNILIEIISKYKMINCESIINDKEYLNFKKDIMSFLDSKGFTLENLKILSGGTYSDVYEIGEYVIKIGAHRNPEYRIDSIYIVPTYLRKNYNIVNDGKPLYLGLEIQKKVEKFIGTEEVLKKIFYSLYEEGYIWGDAEVHNLGLYNESIVIIDSDLIFNKSDKNREILSKNSKMFLEEIF